MRYTYNELTRLAYCFIIDWILFTAFLYVVSFGGLGTFSGIQGNKVWFIGCADRHGERVLGTKGVHYNCGKNGTAARSVQLLSCKHWVLAYDVTLLHISPRRSSQSLPAKCHTAHRHRAPPTKSHTHPKQIAPLNMAHFCTVVQVQAPINWGWWT